MTWTVHIAHIREVKNAYKILVEIILREDVGHVRTYKMLILAI